MAHSNQVREFVLGRHGIEFVDVYVSGAQVLTGTARIAQQSEEIAEARLREIDHDRTLQELIEQRAAVEEKIAALGPRISPGGALRGPGAPVSRTRDHPTRATAQRRRTKKSAR